MTNQQFDLVLANVHATLTGDLGTDAQRILFAKLQIENARRMLAMESRNIWADTAMLHREPVQRESDDDVIFA